MTTQKLETEIAGATLVTGLPGMDELHLTFTSDMQRLVYGEFAEYHKGSGFKLRLPKGRGVHASNHLGLSRLKVIDAGTGEINFFERHPSGQLHQVRSFK